MEKIISIVEATFKEKHTSYDGFIIETDKQIIKLGIENGQSCCENWGYFMSEDYLLNYINSQLISINVVDEQLKNHEEINLNDMYEGDCMFVNIETTQGLLQFVAYNEHNGYYGHDAIVISNQLNNSTVL